MKSKTTKTITVETWRKIALNKKQLSASAWCGPCGIETRMYTPDDFAALNGTTVRSVYKQIENGTHHFMETENGSLLLCGAEYQVERPTDTAVTKQLNGENL
ncbi:MAG: hypothetical protein H7070_13570 [Saprospiraceae bacterium]|nr:hypothetical protein [Pyrinomonadaceae bacterium]